MVREASRKSGLVLAAVIAATLAFAVPAGAATVTRVLAHPPYEGPTMLWTDVVFTAAPGEINTVVASGTPSDVILAQATAPLHVEGGCTQPAPGTARCTPIPPDCDPYYCQVFSSWRRAVIHLGSGDDSFSTKPKERCFVPCIQSGPAIAYTVLGGNGDDRIAASGVQTDEIDLLDGGRGNDVLAPGTSFSEVRCGPGFDRVILGPGAEYAQVAADCEVVTGA